MSIMAVIESAFYVSNRTVERSRRSPSNRQTLCGMKMKMRLV